MIHLLWPTIRPKMMINTYAMWMDRSQCKNNVITHVAVNTEQQKNQIRQLLNQRKINTKIDIHVSGDVVGVTHACHFLSHLHSLDGPDRDIVILASDDMYAPHEWDSWILSKIDQQPLVALLVNDGYIKQNNVTIPIMTMGCLKRLNRIIYHTSYKHSYSDTELYDNLNHLGLMVDTWSQSPVFEHKNWANAKRKFDDVDKHILDMVNGDAHNWLQRQKMPVAERLK